MQLPQLLPLALLVLAPTQGPPGAAQSQAAGLKLHDAFRWVRFTTADGLPDDRVSSLADADDGTPWAATHAGVAWYDGYSGHPARGLPHTRVANIAGDAQGHVVVVSGGAAWAGGRAGFEKAPLSGHAVAVQALPEGASSCWCARGMARAGAS